MSGGGGIGEKSQPFNFLDFSLLSTDQLKKKITEGVEVDDIYNAGLDALQKSGQAFLSTHQHVHKQQYLALADKFIQLFPEKQNSIDVINKFIHDKLGIDVKLIAKFPAKVVQVPVKLQLQDLPKMTAQETITTLKDKPIGTVLARRSSDAKTSDYLAIAVKSSIGTPPYFGVIQDKFPPGANNKFIYLGQEYTIEEIVKLFQENFKPPETVQECEKIILAAKSEKDIELALQKGADKNLMMKAGERIIKKLIIDPKLDFWSLKPQLIPVLKNLKALGGNYDDIDIDKAASLISGGCKDILKGLITHSPLPALSDVEVLQKNWGPVKKIPLLNFTSELLKFGFEAHFGLAVEKFSENVKALAKQQPSPPPTSLSPQTLLGDLPVLTGDETVAQLKDKPVGTWLFRRSSDPKTSDCLVIARTSAPGVVEQAKLLPAAEPGKFMYGTTPYTISQIFDKYNTHFPNAYLPIKKSTSFDDVIQAFKGLEELAAKAHLTIPKSVQKDFSDKVILPLFQGKASPALIKALTGKISELSLEELGAIPEELSKIAPQASGLTPISRPVLADAVFKYVYTHQYEINKDPAIATRAHQILHDIAQREIASGNFKSAFTIEGRAAAEIPLHKTHPLNQMDKVILEGSAKQYDVKSGAFFSSLDTSIVKGGSLHAAQRTIDGKLLNCFDFKISHFARDELTKHLDAIQKNKADFEASLPKGFCTGVKIDQDVPQQFNRYDDVTGEFTRVKGYCPKNSRATEIIFEGAGKIIIGNSKLNGTMYNWIQVEMDANLPPGEGVKKLQQLLAVAGLGPVVGQQPPENNERMKIAQLFRAFYPSKATAFDVKKEFYELSIDELKKKIIADVPQMGPIFKKYLETSPHLMTKIEIMPGKEIWGIKDLGKQMKANGAWGLMTGVGNKGSANAAIERILTQGAFSSEQRFESGNFKEGASSELDMMFGGGDQVFTRLINNTTGGSWITEFQFHGSAQILWDLDKTVQRVPYGYNADKYGVRNRFQTTPIDGRSYQDYTTRSDLITLAGSIHSNGNEFAIKNALDPSHVAGVVVQSQNEKDSLIKHLKSKGLIVEIKKVNYVKFAGKQIKVDDFIHVGSKFKKEWWG